jgi:hypothetical protein
MPESTVNVERGCRSKQVYLSKAHAKQVVRLMGARHRDALHLDRCDACGYWHVEHPVPSAIRARIRDQSGISLLPN